MKVFNPTKDKLSVVISGRQYSVDSGETLQNVPEADAKYWKNSLHNFIVITEESTVDIKKEVDEMLAETKEDAAEEVAEEVVTEDKPKKSNKKSNK